MKVSVKDREGLFKELSVEIEGSLVSSALEEVYKYLRENVSIEGFRRGHAPLWIIKARYRDYIEEEVGKKVADKTLGDAIKESGLRPVARVFLEEVKLEESIPKLTYKVAFEVPPEFELKEVEGLEVEVPKVEFDEELVKKEVEKLREEHALWEPVDREIREGDLVVLDYQVEDQETKEVVEGETSGIVGQRMFREEIDKALVGKREGDTLEFEELTLYDTEGKEAGKAKVKLTIKSVKEKVLPELNDEFAKELGLGETWEEAYKKIEEDLRNKFEVLKKRLIEGAVSRKLVDIHEFDVPKTLLSEELTRLVEQRLESLARYGIDPRYVDYRALGEELTPQAIDNIKIRFILDKYAKLKGIEVSEEDIEEKYEELAFLSGKSIEETKEFIKRENLEEELYAEVLRQKALDDIISKVVIKEVEEKKDEGNT